MNKKILAIVAGLLLFVAAGTYFVLGNKSKTVTTSPGLQEQSVPTISASDIGLTLTPGADKQRVAIEVSKTDDIQSIDYELSYMAKGTLPRGAIGHIDVIKGKPAKAEVYLGTCSDVCHPDTDISNIKAVLKVNKTDGKVYQAEAKTEL